jgi:hypothetical protein
MKTIICTLCFLCATAVAFSQSAGVLSSDAQPLAIDGHAQHASEHAMAQESSLLSTSSYSYAKGEVPLAELGTLEYQTPLGDVARAYRKQRADNVFPKAVKVLEK